jgi:hypothetical protein
MMLTQQEKNDLYEILTHTFGNDPKLRSSKDDFNEQTIEIAEQAIIEDIKCNNRMKELVSGLLQGSSYLIRGWLRKSMRKFVKDLRDENISFKGYACMVGTKSRRL